jgi:hydrophobic/amphiphilic exporter-1 (mainly G- bacteria), HAE1 family
VSLSEICVRRPVFAFMLVMFLVTLGVFSFLDLGVDLFPKSEPANVRVQVRMPGASPEEVVSQLIMPLEEAVSSVAGITEIRSVVNEGSGFLSIEFTLDKEINEAANEVREKVAGAQRRLPPNALPPTVQKSDPESDPIITVALSGNRPQRELTEIADKDIRRTLETVDGVGGVDIVGGRSRQVNILLDINKMNGYQMTAQEVERAVGSENVEAPGGRIVTGPVELGVRTRGRLNTVEDFRRVIIKNVNGAPIRIYDVASVEDGTNERRSFAYYQGKPAVLISVRRQSGMNTVKVVEGIQAKLAEVNGRLPRGVKLDVVREQATYIKNSVEALEEHLILGSVLASIIVFLFIRDWRTVLISSLAIPTSIITTFSAMKLLGFTLNSMTLLGLTLAVGIVIDDAIIVLENIVRYIEEKGMKPFQAAIEATKEITLAVVATTVSLVIIFVPIAFMEGYAKKFLYEFGMTMAVSIMMSMFVAFTVTPAISSLLLKAHKADPEKMKDHGHNTPSWLDNLYVRILDWSLSHRWAILLLCAGVFASTFWINTYVKRDWMPQEDQGELAVWLELPEGSSLQATEKVTKDLAVKLAEIPGVEVVIPQSSPFLDRVTMSYLTLLLKPQDQRPDILKMSNLVREKMRPFMFARPRVSLPNALGGRDTFAPIRAQLLGPDLNRLVDIAKDASVKLANAQHLVDVKVNLNLNNPELQVNVDRQLASDLGVRTADIASAVRLLMSGEDEVSTFKEGSEQYPVTMRLLEEQRNNTDVVGRLLVPSITKGPIRLDGVASVERGLGPSRIDRVNRQFSVGIYANNKPGSSLSEAAAETRGIVNDLELPNGYQVTFSGQVRILEETTRNMLLAFGLASIFMYMVLAAQFESLTHPFVILLTLPLSIPFALLSLIGTGRSLNLFSALGVLLLLGIVKKNGILQIDYMNQLRQTGMDLRSAILEANRVRLRPILMTTLSIIAGLIPTAVGVGAGAGQRSAIAVTIIGGQSLCLVLSLLVVPVGYSLIEDARDWLARRRGVDAMPQPATGD